MRWEVALRAKNPQLKNPQLKNPQPQLLCPSLPRSCLLCDLRGKRILPFHPRSSRCHHRRVLPRASGRSAPDSSRAWALRLEPRSRRSAKRAKYLHKLTLLTPNHWRMQPDVIDVTVFESQNSDHNRHTLLRIWHSFKTAGSWESQLQNNSKKTTWKRLMQPRRLTTTMARITITMAPEEIRAMDLIFSETHQANT